MNTVEEARAEAMALLSHGHLTEIGRAIDAHARALALAVHIEACEAGCESFDGGLRCPTAQAIGQLGKESG